MDPDITADTSDFKNTLLDTLEDTTNALTDLTNTIANAVIDLTAAIENATALTALDTSTTTINFGNVDDATTNVEKKT